MSEKIIFASDNYRLEGTLTLQSDTKAVIITHPHPLYGGDMKNAIVEIIDSQFIDHGYTTLKFNFRGVGDSEGVYADGQGEQDDVFAAQRCLSEKGYSEINAAGYSFGAWVLMGCATANNVFNNIYLISPPVSFMSFDTFSPANNLRLAISGDKDDFAEINQTKEAIKRLGPNATFKTIEGADHFYFGFMDQIEQTIRDNIQPFNH